jgi:dTDP-4-amino-4,6-dideoxygalactose transaminase
MSELALLGGKPVRTRPFPAYQSLGEAEKQRVMAVMDDGILSDFVAADGPYFLGGKQVRAFEEAWSDHFKSAHTVSMNSATSALYAALGAAGVGPGDEVIVTPYTMVASATAALVWGAIPVFADIHPETFCLDPASVRAHITPRTRAIVAVDIFGHPADFAEIMAIAREHNLVVIEDAAQAPGATLQGRMAGTLAHIGVYSLNFHKHIHTGEGGMAVTRDPRLARRLQLIRNHAEVIVSADDMAGLDNMIGQNYRMTELQAAIGIEQLKKLPQLLTNRQQQVGEITGRLKGNPLLAAPTVANGATHAYYVYAMKFRAATYPEISRQLLAKALLAEGLPLRAGYVRPLYLLPMYQKRVGFGQSGWPFTLAPEVSYAPGICPVVERIENHEIILLSCLQGHLEARDLADIGDALEKVALNTRKLAELGQQAA